MGLKSYIQEHSGTACAVGAVAGVFVTAWLSGKAAVNVYKETQKNPFMTRKEKVKLYCKSYWKAAIGAAATTGLIVGSDRIHVGKEAAIATGAAVWKEKAEDIEKALRKEVGDEKANEIKKEIEEEKIKKAESEREAGSDGSGDGTSENMLGQIYVYEPYTDQYFYTTRETIAWAMLKANEKLAKNFDVRLNYIIKMLGGKETPYGDKIGWNWENETQDYCWSYYGGPWIDFIPGIQTKGAPNGRTALVLFYQVDPETQEPEDMIYSEEGGASK